MVIRIVTDSNCDLPQDVVRENQITVIPLYVNFDSHGLLDGVEITREEFYERLIRANPPPRTSAPGVGAFVKVYGRLRDEGASEIISIHIAGVLSNVVNVARLAAEAVEGVTVTVVDSEQLTLGTGLISLAAAQAALRGMRKEEILSLVQDLSARTYAFAAIDTLEYLRRSGRVSGLQSGLGTLLSIKPILKMHGGEMAMERARTRQKAYERLMTLVSELGPLQELALVHTHALDRAELLRQQAASLFPVGQPTLVGEVTPVIGAHTGPGAVGLVAVKAK